MFTNLINKVNNTSMINAEVARHNYSKDNEKIRKLTNKLIKYINKEIKYQSKIGMNCFSYDYPYNGEDTEVVKKCFVDKGFTIDEVKKWQGYGGINYISIKIEW